MQKIVSDTRQGLLMGELPPHLSIHRKISFPPLLCPVQTLLKNQTDSGFTSPTKRQTINRQLFHRPAAFILFRFTIQIGGKASYVKLCLHWSCNLVETNLSLIALLGNKWPAIETKLKSVFYIQQRWTRSDDSSENMYIGGEYENICSGGLEST